MDGAMQQAPQPGRQPDGSPCEIVRYVGFVISYVHDFQAFFGIFTGRAPIMRLRAATTQVVAKVKPPTTAILATGVHAGKGIIIGHEGV
jgi:hypothetical protein